MEVLEIKRANDYGCGPDYHCLQPGIGQSGRQVKVGINMTLVKKLKAKKKSKLLPSA